LGNYGIKILKLPPRSPNLLAEHKGLPTREQAINKSYTTEQRDGLMRVFKAHGMIVTGPPLDVE
jgi:hypothetical protein